VATPVWFVQRGDRLLARTGVGSGKVKGIRRNPAVLVAVCTAKGQLRGPQLSGVARLLPEGGASPEYKLITRKYRAETAIIRPLWFVQCALHVGRRRTTPVILEITPA
jgi:PPOX class probable F420-dependent enzyme